jgi:hypothetical protein
MRIPSRAASPVLERAAVLDFDRHHGDGSGTEVKYEKEFLPRLRHGMAAPEGVDPGKEELPQLVRQRARPTDWLR